MKDEHKTIVIFRKIKGEVVALFPCLPGTNNANTCESYMHTGQHSAATTDTRGWPLATPEEYAPLARELEQIGYNLDIRRRSCPAYRVARVEALK